MSWVCLEVTHPVARKDHFCFACGSVIRKGEQHKRIVGVMYREFAKARYHYECYDFAFYDGQEECSPNQFSREEALEFAREQDPDGLHKGATVEVVE